MRKLIEVLKRLGLWRPSVWRGSSRFAPASPTLTLAGTCERDVFFRDYLDGVFTDSLFRIRAAMSGLAPNSRVLALGQGVSKRNNFRRPLEDGRNGRVERAALYPWLSPRIEPAPEYHAHGCGRDERRSRWRSRRRGNRRNRLVHHRLPPKASDVSRLPTALERPALAAEVARRGLACANALLGRRQRLNRRSCRTFHEPGGRRGDRPSVGSRRARPGGGATRRTGRVSDWDGELRQPGPLARREPSCENRCESSGACGSEQFLRKQ